MNCIDGNALYSRAKGRKGKMRRVAFFPCSFSSSFLSPLPLQKTTSHLHLILNDQTATCPLISAATRSFSTSFNRTSHLSLSFLNFHLFLNSSTKTAHSSRPSFPSEAHLALSVARQGYSSDRASEPAKRKRKRSEKREGDASVFRAREGYLAKIENGNEYKVKRVLTRHLRGILGC